MNEKWIRIVRKDEHDLFLFHYGVSHVLLSDVALIAGFNGVNFAGFSDLLVFIFLHFFHFVDLFG